MKKTLLFSFMSLLIAYSFAQSNYSYSIKLSPLPVFAEYSDQLSYFNQQSRIGLTFEKNVNRKATPFFTVSYVGPVGYWTYLRGGIHGYRLHGVGLAAGIKIYQHEALQGIYLAPVLQYAFYTKRDPNLDKAIRTQVQELTPALLVGKQIIFPKGLTVDLFTGMGLIGRRYKDIADVDFSRHYTFGIRPFLGMQIGFSQKKAE
ncbi:MAG: hypothetical protein ACJ75J_03765 [Cytophagaceae bacterium]